MRNMQPKAGGLRASLSTGVVALLLGASILLFLPGCQGPVGPTPDAGAATGILDLTVERQGARTILPERPDFDSYDLRFVNAEDPDYYHEFEGWAGNPVELSVGYWHLQVTARIDDLAVATGNSWWIYIQEDRRAYTTIWLVPTVGQDSYGNFAWDVTAAGIDGSLSVRVYESYGWLDGTRSFLWGFGGLTGNEELPAGSYMVRFVFDRAGGGSVELVEVLQVFDRMPSRFTHRFDATYFPEDLFEMMRAAWNSDAQNFVGLNITRRHFTDVLDINVDENAPMNELFWWFSEHLGWSDLPFPGTIGELATLVDAALIGILREDGWFTANAAQYFGSRLAAQDAFISYLYRLGNSTPLGFTWDESWGQGAWPTRWVTVSIGPYQVHFDLFVRATGVAIIQGNQTLNPGETMWLSADVLPNRAVNENIALQWSTNDSSVAIDQLQHWYFSNGEALIRAEAEGNATITVRMYDASGTFIDDAQINVRVQMGSASMTINFGGFENPIFAVLDFYMDPNGANVISVTGSPQTVPRWYHGDYHIATATTLNLDAHSARFGREGRHLITMTAQGPSGSTYSRLINVWVGRTPTP